MPKNTRPSSITFKLQKIKGEEKLNRSQKKNTLPMEEQKIRITFDLFSETVHTKREWS